MPKLWKILVLLALISLLGIAIFVLTRSAEPNYGGHALSYWLKRRAVTVKAGRSSHFPDESERALRAIGTNALPWLLRWIKHEPNPMPQFVLQRVEWSSWETPFGHLLRFGPGDALAASVPLAFDTLGTNAAPALNELVAMMNDRAHPATSTRAIMALGSLGEFGLPALAQALFTPSQRERQLVALELFELSHDPAVGTNRVLPFVLRAMNDSDAQVSNYATKVYAQLAPGTFTNSGPR